MGAAHSHRPAAGLHPPTTPFGPKETDRQTFLSCSCQIGLRETRGRDRMYFSPKAKINKVLGTSKSVRVLIFLKVTRPSNLEG